MNDLHVKTHFKAASVFLFQKGENNNDTNAKKNRLSCTISPESKMLKSHFSTIKNDSNNPFFNFKEKSALYSDVDNYHNALESTKR